MTSTKATTRARATTATSRWQGWAGALLASIGIAWVIALSPPVEKNDRSPESQLQQARSDIVKRPSWPYAWMELAVLLARQGYYGDELTHALERTLQLGPHESALEFQRAVFALEHADAPLPAAATKILARSLRAERQRHPALIQSYVVVSRNDLVFCRLPDLSAAERQWCAVLRQARASCRYRLLDPEVQRRCDSMDQHHATVYSNWRTGVLAGYGAAQ